MRNSEHDPLGVLASTAYVVDHAAHVSIDADAVSRCAEAIATDPVGSTWDAALHPTFSGPEADEHTAIWIMLLDALNFCFWGQGSDPQERWRVQSDTGLVDGYAALVAALSRASADFPIHDATYLATMPERDVCAMLAPANGHPDIPLISHRIANIHELGAGLSTVADSRPASALIRSAKGSGIALAREVIRRFPSFNDVATYHGREVGLYKRAQILIGDLAGALSHTPLGQFDDLASLTAFADYKVPQMLRRSDVLRYSPSLAELVRTRTHILAGSPMEVEIRAATIQAVDAIRQSLHARGVAMSAHEIDWHLWTIAQDVSGVDEPYHLTPTVFY